MMRQWMRWLLSGGVVLVALALALPGPAAAAPGAAAAGGAFQDGADWRCVEVAGDELNLNIRTGAGIAFDLLTSLAPGVRLEADYTRLTRADGYDWVPIRLADARQGWGITSRLAPCPTPTAAPAPTNAPAASLNTPSPPATSLDPAADGVLDRYEIAEIAPRVVLVVARLSNSNYSTGSGTIISPDGLIVTNAHVIEGAREIAVAMLTDLNDPAELQYLVEVVDIDPVTDVALLAIRTDMQGQPVLTANLDLPYMSAPLPAGEVYRGDMVYIFGFPGIGDNYLVVTSGSIVSVENGAFEGQTVPLWYRTDAEIAPGSSGGLVVNGDGAFIGIPTFVRSEGQTGGRLGGIRPAEVALQALDTEIAFLPPPTPEPPPASGFVDDLPVALDLGQVWLDHGVVQDAQRGIEIHVAFTLSGWAGRDATVFARFFYDDLAGAPVVNPAAPAQYHDASGAVQAWAPIQPSEDRAEYTNLRLFLPYAALGITEPGSYPLRIQIEVAGDGALWRRALAWETITLEVR